VHTLDPAVAAPPLQSRWIPSKTAAVRLLGGLLIFGTGEALILFAALGNTQWTVLAQGVALKTPLSVGSATVVTRSWCSLSGSSCGSPRGSGRSQTRSSSAWPSTPC
jgi:hypothetical protein